MDRCGFSSIIVSSLLACVCPVMIVTGYGYAMELATESVGVDTSEGMQGPWDLWDETAWKCPTLNGCDKEEGTRFPPSRFLEVPAIALIHFFQQYVSPVDGPSCSFYPTCSSYGLESIRKHGLLLGIPMTAERIIRNHRPDDPDRYSVIEISGTPYYGDPVEANDFWWHLGTASKRSSP